ncbi:hypothetical protein [Methanosarcina siciliae]|uniref:hypothetical protein n=1 Tax=Methanosarcina siciliae TaxID=38027 RepID=UPI0011E5ED51|nr:hypothetical protein [Methanosarcina siciliae]
MDIKITDVKIIAFRFISLSRTEIKNCRWNVQVESAGRMGIPYWKLKQFRSGISGFMRVPEPEYQRYRFGQRHYGQYVNLTAGVFRDLKQQPLVAGHK